MPKASGEKKLASSRNSLSKKKLILFHIYNIKSSKNKGKIHKKLLIAIILLYNKTKDSKNIAFLSKILKQ